MALPNVYKINVQTRVDDKLCSFGIHYSAGAGTDPLSDASNLCAGWDSDVSASLTGVLAASTTLEGLYAHCYEPGQALPHSLPLGSIIGTRTGDACPGNMAGVFTLQINDPAAKRHGRIYVAGFAKSDLEDGLWEAGFFATEMDALATALATPILSGGVVFTPGVVRTIAAGVPITPVFVTLTAVRARQVPYSQRRRTSRQIGFAA